MEHLAIFMIAPESEKLSAINHLLLSWDLKAVEGEAIYIRSMHRDYGHIKIKIYCAPIGSDSKMIWNLNETPSVDAFDIKKAIQKVLEFFLTYLAGIRGENVALIFEVNGGSYHAVDSSFNGYLFATMRAIINCFDKEIMKFDPAKISGPLL